MTLETLLAAAKMFGVAAEPMIQQAFDEMIYPALVEHASKIEDPIAKVAAMDMLPGFKKAVDDSLALLFAPKV